MALVSLSARTSASCGKALRPGASVRLAGLLCLAAALLGGAAEARDVGAMIEELELPSIMSFSVTLRLETGALRDTPTAAEAAAAIPPLAKRAQAGQASAAEWAQLGELYTVADRADEAREAAAKAAALYEAALRARPDDVGALVGLGRLLQRREERERAERLLTRAVEVDPAALSAYAELVPLLTVDKAPTNEALRRLRDRYRGDFVKAGVAPPATLSLRASKTELNRLRPLMPDFVAAWQKLLADPLPPEELSAYRASIAQATRYLAVARPLFRARLAAQPSREVLMQYLQVEFSAALGDLLAAALEAGSGAVDDSAAAMQAFARLATMPDLLPLCQAVSKALPGDISVRATTGTLQALGMLLSVLSHLDEDGPPPPDVDRRLLAQAEANLKAALVLPPKRRPGVLAALLFLQTEQTDRAEALRLMDEATRRGEWDHSAFSMAVLAQSGVRLPELSRQEDGPVPPERYAEIEAAVSRWLQQARPRDAEAWAALAAMRADAGRWELVVEPLKRAVEIGPEPKYLLAQAVACLKTKRAADAETVLRRALAAGITDDELCEEAHRTLGVALWAQGKETEGDKELNWAP